MAGKFRYSCIGYERRCIRHGLEYSLIDSILQEANLASKYCEIIGRVNEDLSVKVLWSTNMGDDLGKKEHWHQYRCR